jgi:2-polyprenyl-6-methoxyphenol hydroxylase-like FAD-dependent oxidoreductase
VKTLVIGAGLAGLTLAARLCQQGRPPVVVERSKSTDAGYAIGLYPLGSCVFHGLGTYEQLAGQSVSVGTYELANGTGRVLQAFDMSVLTGGMQPMLMASRTDLVRLLETSCTTAEMRRGVNVTSIVPSAEFVDVTFDDATTERFDAVVGCDGIGSSTRERVFGAASGFDSGWVLYTWWVEPGRFDPGVVREWWGEACFFGLSPTSSHVPTRRPCRWPSSCTRSVAAASSNGTRPIRADSREPCSSAVRASSGSVTSSPAITRRSASSPTSPRASINPSDRIREGATPRFAAAAARRHIRSSGR